MQRVPSAIIGALASLCVLLSAGCNTDPLWQERQRVDGPLTELDTPEGVVLPDIQLVDAHEVDLVEQVLTHRAMYHRTLGMLHDYYEGEGYEHKRRWTEQELAAVERTPSFKYLLSAEVPAEDLRPLASIGEADEMYQRGLALLKDGGHGTPALYRQELMLQALETFVDLIRTWPSSDKIDDAAFFCGEIHKEYFKDHEPIAVRWYERAWSWDPQTPHPARFQAAVVYDYRLHDRARALELYRQVTQLETRNTSNLSFAFQRITELTNLKEETTPPPAHAQAESLPEGQPDPQVSGS